MENPENREYLSSIQSIGGGGTSVSNMLSCSRRQRMKKWFEEKDLNIMLLWL